MKERICSATSETWRRRVEAWRASGERAEDFCRREGYAASTLRWWSSRLKREARTASPIQLARVIRTAAPVPSSVGSSSAIVIDVSLAGVRVAVMPGAERATLALVLEVLGVGVRAAR